MLALPRPALTLFVFSFQRCRGPADAAADSADVGRSGRSTTSSSDTPHKRRRARSPSPGASPAGSSSIVVQSPGRSPTRRQSAPTRTRTSADQDADGAAEEEEEDDDDDADDNEEEDEEEDEGSDKDEDNENEDDDDDRASRSSERRGRTMRRASSATAVAVRTTPATVAPPAPAREHVCGATKRSGSVYVCLCERSARPRNRGGKARDSCCARTPSPALAPALYPAGSCTRPTALGERCRFHKNIVLPSDPVAGRPVGRPKRTHTEAEDAHDANARVKPEESPGSGRKVGRPLSAVARPRGRWARGAADEAAEDPESFEVQTRPNGVHQCGMVSSRGGRCKLWVGYGTYCKFHTYVDATEE